MRNGCWKQARAMCAALWPQVVPSIAAPVSQSTSTGAWVMPASCCAPAATLSQLRSFQIAGGRAVLRRVRRIVEAEPRRRRLLLDREQPARIAAARPIADDGRRGHLEADEQRVAVQRAAHHRGRHLAGHGLERQSPSSCAFCRKIVRRRVAAHDVAADHEDGHRLGPLRQVRGDRGGLRSSRRAGRCRPCSASR